ncbi:hypothetical protein LINPERHAP1_LOCUS12162 [Linum perenne]
MRNFALLASPYIRIKRRVRMASTRRFIKNSGMWLVSK